MLSPMFSIVTISYNSSKTIERTILSVKNQTCSDYEYIFIDGASTDNTVDIIKSHLPDFSSRAKLISEPDSGIYSAMNKGISMATGKFIGIINSDDWYEPDALESIYNCYKNNQDIDVFYGIVRYWKEQLFYMAHAFSHNYLNEGMLPHPTCFVSKKTYDKYGPYDLKYKSAADYDLFLKMKNCKFHFIPKVIANFSWGGISTTSVRSDKETMYLWKKYKIISNKRYIAGIIKLHIKKLFKSK